MVEAHNEIAEIKSDLTLFADPAMIMPKVDRASMHVREAMKMAEREYLKNE